MPAFSPWHHLQEKDGHKHVFQYSVYGAHCHHRYVQQLTPLSSSHLPLLMPAFSPWHHHCHLQELDLTCVCDKYEVWARPKCVPIFSAWFTLPSSVCTTTHSSILLSSPIVIFTRALSYHHHWHHCHLLVPYFDISIMYKSLLYPLISPCWCRRLFYWWHHHCHLQEQDTTTNKTNMCSNFQCIGAHCHYRCVQQLTSLSSPLLMPTLIFLMASSLSSSCYALCVADCRLDKAKP